MNVCRCGFCCIVAQLICKVNVLVGRCWWQTCRAVCMPCVLGADPAARVCVCSAESRAVCMACVIGADSGALVCVCVQC